MKTKYFESKDQLELKGLDQRIDSKIQYNTILKTFNQIFRYKFKQTFVNVGNRWFLNFQEYFVLPVKTHEKKNSKIYNSDETA